MSGRFRRSGSVLNGLPAGNNLLNSGGGGVRFSRYDILVAQPPNPELCLGHVLTQRRQKPAVRRAHDKRAVAVTLPRSGLYEHSYLEIGD
jgi:hypothetical protein